MRFSFINWICEHYEHCDILRFIACFFSSLFSIFIPSIFESSFYHLYLFHFYLLLYDDDVLSSQSYQSGLSHPLFRLWVLICDS